MTKFERRARGVLLRFVRHRALAIALGLALALPAVWLEFFSRCDAWWADGLALIAGATGLALCWTGLTGTRPDWIDENDFTTKDTEDTKGRAQRS